MGCHADFSDKLDLNEKVSGDQGNKMTMGYCRRFCRGHQYYGLHESNWRFCGYSYGKFEKVDDGEMECLSKCPGNPNELCGAGGRNSIYRESQGATVVITLFFYLVVKFYLS